MEICFIFLCKASNFCVNTSFFSVRFLRACLYSLWHQCLYTVLNNSFPCLLLVRCYSLLILKSLLPNFFFNEISSKNVCLTFSPVKVSIFVQYQHGGTKTKCFLILRPIRGICDCRGVDVRLFCMVQTYGFVN